MIIVAGWIDVAPGDRDTFLEGRRDRTTESLGDPGCIDYVFSPDPMNPGRIRLFERWESREMLDGHLTAQRSRPATAPIEVVGREVNVYDVTASAPLG